MQARLRKRAIEASLRLVSGRCFLSGLFGYFLFLLLRQDNNAILLLIEYILQVALLLYSLSLFEEQSKGASPVDKCYVDGKS